MEHINKADNSYLRDIKDLLRDRKHRESLGKFIVEGSKIVQDILKLNDHIESILCSNSYIKNYPEQIELIFSKNILIKSVKDSFFEKLSVLRNAQGILAVIKKPEWDNAIFKSISDGIILLLDNIQDPGNMGALIRSSVAFSAKAILLYGSSVDVFNPKVVRSSSGMLLNVPIIQVDIKMLNEFKKDGFNILAADKSCKNSVSIFDIKQPSGNNIIVFGNEGNGVSPEILDITDTIFHIPINKKVESLNVSSACSISLFYFTGKTIKGT